MCVCVFYTKGEKFIQSDEKSYIAVYKNTQNLFAKQYNYFLLIEIFREKNCFCSAIR